MILRLSTPAARGILIAAALLLTAALGYSSICNALAVYYAGVNTLEGFERATRLEPSDARNWYLLGRYWQYNLEDPNSQKATQAYQTSLTLDPHSADTWSDLAMAYESQDDMPAARAAFLQAKRAYSLSPEVAWRYGNFLLRGGDTDAAFAEIRRAVEVDPKRGAAAIALSLRVNPDVNEILDRVLPPSQEAYLSAVKALLDQEKINDAVAVWNRMIVLHPYLTLRDAHDLIEVLLQKNRAEEAQQVWNETVIAARVQRPPDPPGSLVWDGGFESDITNVGFAWRYQSVVAGVQIGRDSGEKHSGNFSLRLTFNGLQNLDLQEVCQFVAVHPSTPYRFSAWVQTRSLSTDQGIRFSLFSFGDSGNSMVWTDDVRGTQPWTQIQLPWTSGAAARELRLCINRRPSAQFDSKIHGSAWIDDVTLSPDSAEHARQ